MFVPPLNRGPLFDFDTKTLSLIEFNIFDDLFIFFNSLDKYAHVKKPGRQRETGRPGRVDKDCLLTVVVVGIGQVTKGRVEVDL